MIEKIGFIGLGIMGKPIALNLIKAGYSLFVLEKNRSSSELVEAGARSFTTCKEIASMSDVVITMLPDSPEVEEVVFGEQGVLEGIQKGSLFIDMSTISPATAKKVYRSLQEKEVESLDAPVSGGEVGAEKGTISIMVGGSKKAFDRAVPLFDIIGERATYIGEAGAGQLTKACNQIIIAITMQGVAEAFSLAKKAGVDLVKVREALLGGYAQSRVLDESGKRMIEGNFDPGFKMKLHRKDIRIALQAGNEFSVPLYGSAQAAAHMDSVIANWSGDVDNSAVSLLYEQLSNDKE